jgi:hypothetical protein
VGPVYPVTRPLAKLTVSVKFVAWVDPIQRVIVSCVDVQSNSILPPRSSLIESNSPLDPQEYE